MAETAAPAEVPSAPGAEILVLVAHPELEQSRANRRMLLEAKSLQDVLPHAWPISSSRAVVFMR